jgi:acyl-coenzyme A thioesterase PaaI-like protein
MADPAPPAEAYPPRDHLLRDLGIVVLPARGGRLEATLPAGALGRDGCVPAGVLATLVDVAGGGAALAAARPGWIATAGLDLRLRAGVHGDAGTLVVQPELLRRSRSRVTLEVRVQTPGVEAPCALAVMDFAVLEARGEVQRQAGEDASTARLAFERQAQGPAPRLRRRLGLRIVDAPAGVCELPHEAFVCNSLGALQGGALAILADAAVEAAGGARTEALTLHYLALGRVGPYRSEARVLRRDAAGAWVRARIHDRGADERLLALVDARVGSAGDAAPSSGSRPS